MPVARLKGTPVICRSCNSERCGNHAACARKKQAEESKAKLKQEQWDLQWASFMAYVYWRMRQQRPLETQALENELDLLRKTEPLIYNRLQVIAHIIASLMLNDM